MNNPKKLDVDVRSTLVDLLNQACEELFSGYEIFLTDVNTELEELDKTNINLIALIGLSEEFFRSSLTLCVSSKLLKTSFPAPDNEVSEDDLHDWLGELSNQLAGRFKNKVVPYGHKLEMGIPTVIQGAKLKIDGPKCSNITKHQFVSAQGDIVEMNLSTLIDDKFVLFEPEETEEDTSLAEGEMLFF
jgi:CheY-specific phosphatase CheX